MLIECKKQIKVKNNKMSKAFDKEVTNNVLIS